MIALLAIAWFWLTADWLMREYNRRVNRGDS